MAKNIAEQLVEMLIEAGIKRVYAVAGDSLNHFNVAVQKSGKIQWIHVRHEEVGAFAAAAEAELDGLACCAGSCGPGHIHLINGVYEAHRSHIPMLVIASTIPTNEMGTDYFQETNTLKLFDDCSLYNQMITTAAQAPRIMQAALQHAISERGVAVIGLPGDISELDAQEERSSQQLFRPNPTIIPSDGELQQLAQLINTHEKVTLFCGIGARDAAAEVLALAQLLQAPVAYSFRAKMAIEPDNPHAVGMSGLLGLPSAYEAMHEADLLLLLGTDFPYESFMPTSNTIIQIDIKAAYLGRRAKLTMGLVGSIAPTVNALIPLLDSKQDATFLQNQVAQFRKFYESNQKFTDNGGDDDQIQPEFVANLIGNYAQPNAIFTLDTGMTCVWGAWFIPAHKLRKMLGSFNHGSMANAMPMAIGAALAHPEKQVIAMCGDGGLSMLLGDLATIKQYDLPIKIIVFNNRSLGMVKLEMQVAGLVDSQTDMVNPDFAMVAAAMGIESRSIHEAADVGAALQTAFSHKGPYLVNIFTNPNALAMPPRIEANQVLGMTKSMAKLMLQGHFGEAVDIIKSNYKHL